MRLSDCTYDAGGLSFRSRHMTEPESALLEYIGDANRILAERNQSPVEPHTAFAAEVESLRWFAMPGELRAS